MYSNSRENTQTASATTVKSSHPNLWKSNILYKIKLIVLWESLITKLLGLKDSTRLSWVHVSDGGVCTQVSPETSSVTAGRWHPSFSFFTDNLGTIPDSIEQTAVKEKIESKITKWSCLDDREEQNHYIEKREVKRENKLLHLWDFRKQVN